MAREESIKMAPYGSEYDFFDDEDIFGSEETHPKQTPQVNKDFESILNPDTSKNAWMDSPYKSRYENNPAVQDFLKNKAGLLQRRGDYIEAEAAKGNIDPYVKHANWLQKQNVFPNDAEQAFSAGKTFLNNYGLGSLETNNPAEQNVSGLFEHDVFSHAFPEKYLGKVDKSLPKAVTAADESRAGLIDTALDKGFNAGVRSNFDPQKKVLPSSSVNKLSQELLDPRRYGNNPTGDVDLEAEYFTEKYLQQAGKEGYKNPYGTSLEERIDPLVGREMGSPTIRQSFEQAAQARYPSVTPTDTAALLNKGVLPYKRDLNSALKMQLYDRALSGLNKFTGEQVSPETTTLFRNTYFSQDPVTAGIQGAGEMLRSAPRGIAGGAALSALSPEVAQSVAQGQYGKAATQTAQSVVGGAATDLAIQATGQGLQRMAPQLAGRVIPAFSGVANVAVPAAVGAGLFMQGKQGSPLNTIVNKAANVVPGLRSNPKTDAGRMAGHAIGNEAQYAWNQIRQGRMPWMGHQ
jgi:hypothetical protein